MMKLGPCCRRSIWGAIPFFSVRAEPGSAGEQFSLQTKELVDATADQMRRISRDLMPSTLGRFGWLASVKELFEVIEKQGGIKTKIMEGEGLPQLRPEEALGLYRIIQEATNNTLKHAEATLIQLEVKKGTAGLELKYSDNGKGFSLPEAKDRKSLGLKNIESRAQILGAKLEILSAEREGVKISINLPVVLIFLSRLYLSSNSFTDFLIESLISSHFTSIKHFRVSKI